MQSKPTHGGKRKGSGRKPNEYHGKQPTRTISVRVPVDRYDELKAKVKIIIATMLQK